jgi:tetratricopeptide (TPR) repeat protein
LKRTDEAIKEIEVLGASTGQVRLLRGVAAYFRQDVRSAISELEQAVQLLPDSVAARALLAMSYGDVGQIEKVERLTRDMAQLSPSSPEDYLFRGYASEVIDLGGLGLADLDEGIRQRDSPLGRALRAIARANRAIDSGRRRDAMAALDDANAARGMLKDNPLALFASLYARTVAAGTYKDAQLPRERAAVLQEAEQDIKALGPFIELPNSAFALWLYYEEIGDNDKALAAARPCFKETGCASAAFDCVVSLYQQRRFPEALKLLDDQRRQPDLLGDELRLFLLAELHGPDRALEEYKKFDETYPRQGTWPLRTRRDVLLFLGKKTQALEILRTLPSPFAFSQNRVLFWEGMRQVAGDQLSEKGLLDRAGTSGFKRCIAHWQIGLFRLADGDRKGAQDHFQKAVATRAIWIVDWAWSKMFLSRLQTEDRWPRWITDKQDGAQR